MAVTAGGSLRDMADSVRGAGPEAAGPGAECGTPPRASVATHDEDSLERMLAGAQALRARTAALRQAGMARSLGSRQASLRSLPPPSKPKPLWAPTGKVPALGPARAGGRRRTVDPRKAELVRKRHEWYERQAALPGKQPDREMQELRLRQRAAACLELTGEQRRAFHALETKRRQDAAKRQALHTKWTETVYKPMSTRMCEAVDAAKDRTAQRREAFASFLHECSVSSLIHLDHKGGTGGAFDDPMELNRRSVRVAGAPISSDPLKLSLVKGGFEGQLLLGGGARDAVEAMHSLPTRTSLESSKAWVVHKVQPRRSVPGASHAPDRVHLDQFDIDRSNAAVASDFPRLGKRPVAVPSRGVGARETLRAPPRPADVE